MEYVQAFKNEIATENLVTDIGKRIMSVFKFIGELIKKAISFLTTHLSKLNRIKKTDKDPTPNSQSGAGAEVMQKKAPKVVYAEDCYDCGNELTNIVADIDFCVQLLMKRPKPDYKVNKSYADRWEQDNSLIADRMNRCLNELEKLEGISNKTVSTETGEKLKAKLEELNAQYDKYGRIYQMFINKHQGIEQYMISTQVSFNLISSTGAKALNIILQLYTPAD